jgi:hypothetical protein
MVLLSDIQPFGRVAVGSRFDELPPEAKPKASLVQEYEAESQAV